MGLARSAARLQDEVALVLLVLGDQHERERLRRGGHALLQGRKLLLQRNAQRFERGKQ